MHKEFQFPMLNEAGIRKAEQIIASFDRLLDDLVVVNPDASREMSLCRTKLEEAAFYAKKAMALDPFNRGGR